MCEKGYRIHNTELRMWMQKTGCEIKDTWFMIYKIEYIQDTGYMIHTG